MSIEAQQALVQWIAFMLCVALGYALSGRVRIPESPLVWVLLAVAVFAFGFVPAFQRPVIILAAPVPLGTLIWGVGIGAVLGLMIRQKQSGKSKDRSGDQDQEDKLP